MIAAHAMVAPGDAGNRVGFAYGVRTGSGAPSMLVKPGETMMNVADDAVIEYGSLTVEMVMMDGSSLSLDRVLPGDPLVSLDALATPAFTLCYRADRPTRIARTRRRPDRERVGSDSLERLLGACMRRVHELACLQTSHRLYGELLRYAAEAEGGADLPLPSHGQLALKLCTTRETISRELSFLRNQGVLSPGRSPRLLNRGFLVSSLSRALGVADEADVLACLGIVRDA